ncbi:hypothetical protein [Nocardia salmonicida]|uniref:Uncharacterized protein n=1 Tax=Nocardia salmonicida TaxID=53431 RepID=A0ABZ1N0V5_9NOCA|nr:hypothetical protein [Nocardia salmonicida]
MLRPGGILIAAAISRYLDVVAYGVEGPAWPTLDHAGQHSFRSLVTAALHCARLLEQDPLLIDASAHLLAIARTGH